jgi:hypothetical protein
VRAQPSDTNLEVEKVLIDLIRQKSIPQKLSVLGSLSSLVIQLSKRAIARKNPALKKREINLLFVKFHYGESLYNRVKDYLLKSI